MWFMTKIRNNKDLLTLKVFGYSNMKIFFILLFGFMCSNHTFAKTKFSEVEKALKEDDESEEEKEG